MIKTGAKWAARGAQRVSGAFSPGRDPGVPGSSPHRVPAGSLLLPLPVSLPLSLSVSLMNK